MIAFPEGSNIGRLIKTYRRLIRIYRRSDRPKTHAGVIADLSQTHEGQIMTGIAFHLCEALWAADFLIKNRVVVDYRLRRALERRIPRWQALLNDLPPADVAVVVQSQPYLFPDLPNSLPDIPDA